MYTEITSASKLPWSTEEVLTIKILFYLRKKKRNDTLVCVID